MSPEKVAGLVIERIALADMKPHPKNPRKHPRPGSPGWQVLRKSLERDYFDPLVLNRRNGMLVSGHLRQRVLAELGFTHADVSVVDYDEATHLARLIAANNPIGEFLKEALEALAGEIGGAGLEAALAGMEEDDFAALAGPPAIQDDTGQAGEMVSAAEQLQEAWRVREGDVFQIGRHRLLCGDCTAPRNWERLLAGELADMVWTDPPYNVRYDDIQRRRNELKAERGKSQGPAPEAILNDDLPEAEYSDLLHRCFAVAFAFTKPGAAIYVAHADSYGLLVRQAVAAAGFHVAQCLIWVKNGFTLGRQDYQWQHEPVLYGWKPGAGHYWQGGFSQATVIDDEAIDLKKTSKEELLALIQQLRNARETTVVRAPRNPGTALHPTVKPILLVARQVWNSSRPNDLVLELYGGSGTTLLAAEQTGRRCVATELAPKYCAVILERASSVGLTVERINDNIVVG